MIQDYRKKPVVIQAVQVDYNDNAIVEAVMRWAGQTVRFIDYNPETNHYENAYVDTLEGKEHISQGDFLIKGVAGEYYPCKPDIFALTYEKVENE